jgi:hypothetical protein
MKASGSEVHGRRPDYLSNTDYISLDSRLEELRRIGHPHLFHHIGTVSFNGLDADFEPLTDLLILKSGPDQF